MTGASKAKAAPAAVKTSRPAAGSEGGRTPRSARRGGDAMPFAADGAPPAAEAAPPAVGGGSALTDEEIAWRLHKELNAFAPVLRTRSRKQLGDGEPHAAAAPAAAETAPAPEQSSGAGSGSKPKPKAGRAVEDGPPAKKAKQQKGSKAAAPAGEAAAEEAAAEAEAAPTPAALELPAVEAQPLPGEDAEDAAARAVAAAAVAAVIKAEEQAQQAQRPREQRAAPPAVKQEQQQAEEAPLSPRAAAAAGGKQASKGKAAAAAVGSKPEKGGKAGKAAAGSKPEKAAAASGKAAAAGGKAAAGGGKAAAAGKGKGGGSAAPAKVLKIPRLPMVRHARKWYRCRVLKDTGDKVLMGERSLLLCGCCVVELSCLWLCGCWPGGCCRTRGCLRLPVWLAHAAMAAAACWRAVLFMLQVVCCWLVSLLPSAAAGRPPLLRIWRCSTPFAVYCFRLCAEFSGMEAEIPTCWIPRDSDRIWRGSYKGKVRRTGCSEWRLLF